MYSSEIEGSSPLADTIVYASLAELVYAAYKTTLDLYLIAHNRFSSYNAFEIHLETR
jgi:hypothetical protein